uniref:Integrase-type DNA-binding superfamily protein n=1 Tax=Panagrellus redivivus TaxID=6233 RepID=A0A7E4VQP1_PANRE
MTTTNPEEHTRPIGIDDPENVKHDDYDAHPPPSDDDPAEQIRPCSTKREYVELENELKNGEKNKRRLRSGLDKKGVRVDARSVAKGGRKPTGSKRGTTEPLSAVWFELREARVDAWERRTSRKFDWVFVTVGCEAVTPPI